MRRYKLYNHIQFYSKYTCLCLEQPQQPTITLLGSPLEDRNATAIARCTTSGFWPESINVNWTLGEYTEQASSLNITDLGNRSFSMTSDFVTSVNRTQNGKTMSCSVTHVSLTSPRTTSVPITVLCKYV